MNRDVLNLFGGVAVLVGLVGSCALMTTFSSSRSSSPSPQSPITCTATIPASQAGEETQVVFTGRSGGDGFSINTTGLRLTQQFEINGSMIPDVDTSRFEPDKYYSIDNSSVGENPSIDTLRNATLVVVEGGKFTHTGVPIICPSLENG
jgi:hypothetical protein